MKNKGLMIVIVLLLLMAANSELNAQRGKMGPVPDSLRMRGQGRGMFMAPRMQAPQDFMRMHAMAHMQMQRGQFGMGHQAPMRHRGPAFKQYRRGFESIPGLTEKQKKEIGELRKKHHEEMQKFREETMTKSRSMKEAHKKSIMNLLTDEQKKFIDEKLPRPQFPGAPAIKK